MFLVSYCAVTTVFNLHDNWVCGDAVNNSRMLVSSNPQTVLGQVPHLSHACLGSSVVYQVLIIIIIIGIYKAPIPKVCPRALYKQNGSKTD